MTATVVSVINMKGGVGKTTLAFNLAWFSAYEENLKVLTVDVDPQANLSQYFMGDFKYWDFLEDEESLSVCDVFEKSTWTTEVIKDVCPNYRWLHLDLVPSRIELTTTLKNPTSKERRLAKFISGVKEDYDIILLDCPPTDSILTTACYIASDYVIIPVRPERLATVGLPLLARSIQDINSEYLGEHELTVAGIIFNDVRQQESPENISSKRYVERFAEINKWNIFENQVRQSDSYPKGSRESTPIFLTNHARDYVKDEMSCVGKEFLKRVGVN